MAKNKVGNRILLVCMRIEAIHRAVLQAWRYGDAVAVIWSRLPVIVCSSVGTPPALYLPISENIIPVR